MMVKILIVDDETDLVETLGFRLEAAGYEVLKAYDGQEGLKTAKTVNPDLILLDVMMPRLDGYQVCRLLKFDVKYADIPIIMLTARDQGQDKAIGEEVRADLYVTKPFDSKDLLAKIKGLLKDRSPKDTSSEVKSTDDTISDDNTASDDDTLS